MKVGIYVRIYNEPNIIEWMSYYYKCGFDFIIIYDDYSDISVEEIINNYGKFDMNKYYICDKVLDKLGSTKTATWNNNILFQKYIMPIFLHNNLEYVLTADMDEYLYLDKYKNINELINDYSPFSQLYIRYKNFGHSFLKNNETHSLVNVFIKSSNILKSGKSLVKVSSILSCSSPHFSYLNNNEQTIDQFKNSVSLEGIPKTGCPLSTDEFKFESNIYLAHYYTQDMFSFIKRRIYFKQNWHIGDAIIKNDNVAEFLKNENIETISNSIEYFDKNKNLEPEINDTLKTRICKRFWKINCFSNKYDNLDIKNFYNNNNNIDFYNTNNFCLCDKKSCCDIYFSNVYGKACEISDDGVWECCIYKDLIYVYLKKPYLFEEITYFDLITPYGYSGYFYTNDNTFEEFIILFRKKAKELNYLTEVVRQNPYLNINLTNYNIITSRTTFGIDLKKYSTFDDYLKDTHKDNKKGYKLAIKKKLIFKKEEYTQNNLNKFLIIYNSTMKKLNASNYYYFSDEYYQSFFNFDDNVFFANIYIDDVLISSSIIFKYDSFIHYHLGGSLLEHRNLRPNNLLHCEVIRFGIENNFKLYHLGGGLYDDDTLYTFKNKIGDTKYNYTIYKNILNTEVYNKIKNSYDNAESYFPIHRK